MFKNNEYIKYITICIYVYNIFILISSFNLISYQSIHISFPTKASRYTQVCDCIAENDTKNIALHVVLFENYYKIKVLFLKNYEPDAFISKACIVIYIIGPTASKCVIHRERISFNMRPSWRRILYHFKIFKKKTLVFGRFKNLENLLNFWNDQTHPVVYHDIISTITRCVVNYSVAKWSYHTNLVYCTQLINCVIKN